MELKIRTKHVVFRISEPEKSWTKIKALKPKPADPKPINIRSEPDPLPRWRLSHNLENLLINKSSIAVSSIFGVSTHRHDQATSYHRARPYPSLQFKLYKMFFIDIFFYYFFRHTLYILHKKLETNGTEGSLTLLVFTTIY